MKPTTVVNAQQTLTGEGLVIGQPEAARVGQDVLDAGGNAVDAAVAAGLAAGVAAIGACGIGGYGGHVVIALGGKVTAMTSIPRRRTRPAPTCSHLMKTAPFATAEMRADGCRQACRERWRDCTWPRIVTRRYRSARC